MSKNITLCAVNREQFSGILERLSVMVTEFDKPLQITVEPLKEKRSNEQNRMMWAIHGQVAAWLNINSETYTTITILSKERKKRIVWSAQMVHDTFYKPRFCTKSNGKQGSSTESGKHNMSNDITAYMAWAYQLGVELEINE